MRVLLTGSNGFVGRWLRADLTAAGHEVVAAPSHRDLDLTDLPAVRALLEQSRPDAIAHLAGVSFAPDVQADPAIGFHANILGTATVLEACRTGSGRPIVLVTGSSEVYRVTSSTQLPLSEMAELGPRTPYGLSKLAQEAVAVEAGAVHGLPVIVTRAFNHAGPGQRPDFVVAAIARRIAEAAQGGSARIVSGNLDVRRDISDVRDVVRAYRLLLEASADGRLGARPVVANVGSGRSVSIRWIVGQLAAAAGLQVDVVVDPALVRPDDPAEIRADVGRLESLTGWKPAIPLEQTLADVMAAALADANAGATPAG